MKKFFLGFVTALAFLGVLSAENVVYLSFNHEAETASAANASYNSGYSAGYNAGYVSGYSSVSSVEDSYAPAPAPQTNIVYVTRTGKKYHRYGCQYLKDSCIEKSLSDAIAQGYTACSKCGG